MGLEKSKCGYCGVEFVPPHEPWPGSGEFCTVKCRSKSKQNARYRRYYSRNRSKIRAAREKRRANAES